MLPRRLYNIRRLPRCKGSGHLWLALPADIAVIAVHSTYGGFYISDVDDRDYLVSLIKATIPALPKAKLKKNPMK